MPLLQIKLLGDFSLVYDKQPLREINTARLQSLLCYLMLHRNAPQSRQHLSFLLWPDSLEGQARTNLRQLLHHLRRSLPLADQFLDITGHSLQWRLDSNFQLDVAEFDFLANELDCANPAISPSLVLSKLERAVALYGGELLPSCYDEWILPERDRLHSLFLKLLEKLVEQLEEQRQYQNAILYAERLLKHDLTCESATLRLMRLNALNGERDKALRVYHRCVTVLSRELDISPGLAVREAYKRLLSMETSATKVKKQPVGLVDAFPLVGREKEWKKLQFIWQTCVQGVPHFVSITGEAGIGKSRLAQELLAWARRQGITRAWTRSYHAEGKLAYAPVVDWLRSHALKPTLNKLEPVWLTEVAPSRVPVDKTAFSYRATPFVLNIHTRWQNVSDDHKCMTWARDFHVATQPFAKGVYVNFLSEEGEGRVKDAYTETAWDRLVQTKQKYDPENLFRMNQNIKP